MAVGSHASASPSLGCSPSRWHGPEPFVCPQSEPGPARRRRCDLQPISSRHLSPPANPAYQQSSVSGPATLTHMLPSGCSRHVHSRVAADTANSCSMRLFKSSQSSPRKQGGPKSHQSAFSPSWRPRAFSCSALWELARSAAQLYLGLTRRTTVCLTCFIAKANADFLRPFLVLPPGLVDALRCLQ